MTTQDSVGTIFEKLLFRRLRKRGITPVHLAMFGYAVLYGKGLIPESQKYPGKRETPAEFLAEVLKDVPIEDRLKVPGAKAQP